jgi:hypothetical protein
MDMGGPTDRSDAAGRTVTADRKQEVSAMLYGEAKLINRKYVTVKETLVDTGKATEVNRAKVLAEIFLELWRLEESAKNQLLS